jgi:hypothetical protein
MRLLTAPGLQTVARGRLSAPTAHLNFSLRGQSGWEKVREYVAPQQSPRTPGHHQCTSCVWRCEGTTWQQRN